MRQSQHRYMASARILVIDDDEPTLDAVAEALGELGYATERCHDAEIARTRPDLPVVLMTAYGDTTAVSRAMRSGVVDFLEKPFTLDSLSEAIERAVARRRGMTPIDRLPPTDTEATALPGMVGSSPPM